MDPLSLAAGAVSIGAKLWGAKEDRKSQEQTAQQNIALQREFAQNGIQWKVEDAKKAGIHPIFAMGANTHSFAPVSIGSNMAGAMSDIGQDISRAVQTTATPTQRADATTAAVAKLQLTRAGLENELLATQIARQKRELGPPMPAANQSQMLDGQTPTNIVPSAPSAPKIIEDKPMERQMSAPGQLHSEAGAIAAGGFTRTRTGWAPVMSKDAKDRLEEDHWGTLMHNYRNYLLPNIGINRNPPPLQPPPGYRWTWHRPFQEYRIVKDNRTRYRGTSHHVQGESW